MFIVGAILFGLTLTSTKAQEVKPYLVVKVQDENGNPLSNVSVQVIRDGRKVANEMTDSTGIRIFSILNLGHHVVVVYYGSETQKVELNINKEHNELFLEIGREQLSSLVVEAEPVLIEDSYGGSVSLGKRATWCYPGRGNGSSGPTFQYWDSPLVGGVWFSDTRAPTFQNMMNMQPND